MSILSVLPYAKGPARAASPGENRLPLDHSDKQSIRKSVYEGHKTVAHPTSGEFAGLEVLVVPQNVKTLYTKNPHQTLLLLRGIVEGGRPKDALLAGGYAIALGDSIVAGAIMSAVAPEGEFDALNERTKETPREFLLRRVSKVIDNVKK
jgi:hypothetical protein